MAKEPFMLAADLAKIGFDFSKVAFPKYMSPKIDGFRTTPLDGTMMSRNRKPLNNRFVQKELCGILHAPLDGEIVVGSATEPGVFGRTQSGVKAAHGEPDFKLHVFDTIVMGYTFRERQLLLKQVLKELRHPRLVLVPQKLVHNAAEAIETEVEFLEMGYEGGMLRAPNGHYRLGRSTPTEDDLWKLKRYIEGEGRVLRLEEAEYNGNEAFKDAIGRTKRSSAKAGKSGNGMVGAVVINDPKWGEMRLSPGIMTHAERRLNWEYQNADAGTGLRLIKGSLIGKKVQWRAFGYGVKDKPRFPRFYGLVADK